MHHFTYREDELYCENVAVQKIAAEIGRLVFALAEKQIIFFMPAKASLNALKWRVSVAWLYR